MRFALLLVSSLFGLLLDPEDGWTSTALHVVTSYTRTIFRILWRVEPLLCTDREISIYTRAVSMQRLGKHVPAATNTHAIIIIIIIIYFNCKWVFIRWH
jgi:hypothetical protein